MRSCVKLSVGEQGVCVTTYSSRSEGGENCIKESGKRGKTARGKGKQDSQASMRGGDGFGMSALDPHLEHVSTEQQSGRPTRHSGRRENSLVAQVGSPRVGSSSNAREAWNEMGGNLTASTSNSHEGNGLGARVLDEVGRGVIIRGGESSGHGSVVTRNLASKELESSRGRSRRRESGLPIVQGVDNTPREVPTRNGFVGNGTVSLPMNMEPAKTRRPSGGAVAGARVDEQRASKKRRNVSSKSTVRTDADTTTNGSIVGDSAATGNQRQEDAEEIIPEPQAVIERVGELFPSIADDLGIQCLTRLPRHRIYHMALVCKKWKEYLLGPELYKQRQLHNIREDWVFMLVHDKRWRAFLPNMNQLLVLPPCPCDYTFESCDKESMVAGLNLLVLGQNREGYVIWKFDTISGKWSTTPKMLSDRCMFGSASFGSYAYFAGGSSHATILNSAERYDSETNSWEQLAEMNHKRKACSGFVMDGKFHVIGGHRESGTDSFDSSGEAYDPQTNSWTLIEGMWPSKFIPSSSTSVSPPLVAVLDNQLYAVDVTQNMLMLYDRVQNIWNPIEAHVPFRVENSNGWGLAFKAVGNELFVIGGGRGLGVKIYAYRPRTDGDYPWRLVADLKFHTNGFIYNCAVMSG